LILNILWTKIIIFKNLNITVKFFKNPTLFLMNWSTIGE